MSDNYIPWWVPADHPARSGGALPPEPDTAKQIALLADRVTTLEKVVPAMERRLPRVVEPEPGAKPAPVLEETVAIPEVHPREAFVPVVPPEPTIEEQSRAEALRVADAERGERQAELERERRGAFTPGVPAPGAA